MDSSFAAKPDTGRIRHARREVTYEMDMSYGLLGSLFRSGSRLTFFASQVLRYADIYAASIVNMVYYPFFYMFNAPALLVSFRTVDTIHICWYSSNYLYT
jgi:5'-nucleotidase